MSRTRTGATARRTKSPQSDNGAPPSGEVMTLVEAAAYLRVAPEDVVRMIREQGLPARQIGTEWRFLKAGLQDWLRTPPSAASTPSFWDTHFGALKDDPYLEEMLGDIYRRRGRPETEPS